MFLSDCFIPEMRSESHRIVAKNLCLGNPDITTVEAVDAIVTFLNTFSVDAIESITLEQFVERFTAMGGTDCWR